MDALAPKVWRVEPVIRLEPKQFPAVRTGEHKFHGWNFDDPNRCVKSGDQFGGRRHPSDRLFSHDGSRRTRVEIGYVLNRQQDLLFSLVAPTANHLNSHPQPAATVQRSLRWNTGLCRARLPHVLHTV